MTSIQNNNIVKVDSKFQHPFTCLVSGQTQSGKSTFVSKLLLNQDLYIDKKFEYIFIFLGTTEKENKTLVQIKERFPKVVKIFNLKDIFPLPQNIKKYGDEFIKELVENQNGKVGCVIFDDLMKELSDNDILIDLFTKYSSHRNVSVINITQNVFFRGKNASYNITLYRNSHILVLFSSFLDNTTLRTISSRISPSESKIERQSFQKMLQDIQKEHRYIVIRGDFNTPEAIRISSSYFSYLDDDVLFLSFKIKQ